MTGGFDRGNRRAFHAGALTLAVLLIALMIPGCAGSQPGVTSVGYVIQQRGQTIGTEKVKADRSSGRTVYETEERRPFMQLDTTYFRRVTLSSDRNTASYYATQSQPGATYHTWIQRHARAYDYLRDEIITVDYFAGLDPSQNFLPFEEGSAGMIQPFVDTWKAAGSPGIVVILTTIPSRGVVFYEAIVKPNGPDAVMFEVPDVGKYSVKLDKNGTIESVTGNGLTIMRGSTGRLISRPYEPSKVQVEQVSVKIPGGKKLAGSLYLPPRRKKFPAAVLVGDTGPQDRTDSGVLSGLAESLAQKGIAALTCDRRGIPESTGKYAYTLKSATDNLDSQVEFLVLRPGVDVEKISVIGYGEGGAVAASCASENPYVSSCVFMATPSAKVFPDLMVSQAQEQAGKGEIPEVQAQVKAAFAGLMTNILQSFPLDKLNLVGHVISLAYMRSFASFDIKPVLQGLKQPALVVQGSSDEAVNPSQAAEIMAALGSRPGGVQKLELFPGLGHGFGPLVDEAAARTYRSHYLLRSEVSSAVASWLSGL